MRAGTTLTAASWYTGLGLTLAMILVYVAQPALLRQLDLNIHDACLRLLERGEPSSAPILVDIDEASLAQYGQWPWPRYRLAALVDRLGQAGVAAVGLDMLLSEADRTSPALLREQLRRDFGLTVRFDGLPEEIEDNDAILAQVLRTNPAVLGCYFRFDDTNGDSGAALSGPAVADAARPGARPARDLLTTASTVSLPLPAFMQAAAVAFYNVGTDQDGLVRRVPLVMQAGGHVHASLALRTLMTARGVSTLVLESGPDGLAALRLGGQTIPVSPDGTMPLLFRGPAGTYPVFSAANILQGRIDPTALNGRVAFVGASATGLRDIRATPLDRNYPGMETHAAVVDAILSQRFLTIPPWTPGAQILLMLTIGIFGILVFGRSRPTVYIPMTVLLVGALWLGGLRLFAAGVYLSPLYALLTVGAQSTGLLGLRFWHEERQRRTIHQAFSRYVSPEIVGRIADSGRADVALAGEERILTVLFADIRGFTSLSEKLSPDQVVSLLNRYFTPMTTIVREHQGTLDKFIGDALMAFWNAPLDVSGHAVQGVKSALAMHAALRGLNATLGAELGFTLDIGIGLHTGPAFVGNMGTTELLAYTAVGDNVNLASRLEGLCPVYGVGIIASGETANQCPQQRWLRLDRVRVKGKALPVELFTPLDGQETHAAELAAFTAALADYDAGRFAVAARNFEYLQTTRPTPLYRLYVERCTRLTADPPANWDGVWIFTAK